MIFEFAKEVSAAEYQQFEAHSTDLWAACFMYEMESCFQLSGDLTSRMRFLVRQRKQQHKIII